MTMGKKHLKYLVEYHTLEYSTQKENMALLKELVEGCPIEFPSLATDTSVADAGAGAAIVPSGPESGVQPEAGSSVATASASSPEPAYAVSGESDDNTKAPVLGEPDYASEKELEGEDDGDDDIDEMDLGSIANGVKLVQTVMTMF